MIELETLKVERMFDIRAAKRNVNVPEFLAASAERL